MYREQIMKKKENKIAGLNPVCKLTILGMYIVLIVLANIVKIHNLPLLLIPLSLCVFVFFAISGQPKDYFKFLKVVAFLVIFLFLVQSFLIKGQDPVLLWQWKFLKIHREGLAKGIGLGFNIMNFAGIFYWLFKTSTYQEISTAMQQSGLNYKAAYVFLSTFNMIEVLSKNTYKIMDAQRARGVETEGNVITRFKAFYPILVPLVVNAFLEVGERALTLESKAFNVKCEKTILIPVGKNGFEGKALAIMAVIDICAIGGTIAWLIR